MTAPIALSCVTLDTADPPRLAEFYSELMGWKVMHSQPEYALITDGRSVLCFGFAEGHVAAPWPDDPSNPKRVHFDLNVDDIDQASARATELGATVPDFQPGLNPDWEGQQPWGIVLDPEGHPICLNLRE